MISKIEIPKKELAFRDDAKNISRIIRKKAHKENAKKIMLDFSQVDFFSRSFADELLNVIDGFQHKGIVVEIVQLRPPLQTFIHRIKRTKEKIRREIGATAY